MFSQFFSRNIKLFPVIVAFSFNTEYFRRKFYTPEYVQALSVKFY